MTTGGGAGPASASPPRRVLPVADRRQVVHELRAVLSGRWGWGAGSVAALVVEAVVALLPAVAIGRITQAVVDHRPLTALTGPLVLLLVAAVVGAAATWAAGVLLARTVLPAVARLREDVLGTSLTLPVDDVEGGGLGDLVGRVSGDVDVVTEAAENALGSFAGAALAIVTTLVGLAALDWRLALAGLLAVPIQAHTLRWYLRTSRPLYAGGRLAEGRRTGSLLAVFGSLATLRAFRLERTHRDAVEASSAAAMDYEFRVTRAATRFYGRLNGAEFVALGAILVVADVLVRHHELSVGAATTAALFFVVLFDPINTVLGVFDEIQAGGAGLARLVGITRLAPRDRAAGAPAPARSGGALEAHGVTAGYGTGPDVLHGVDLVIAPGEHVALVGTTGSGKTTLAAVLTGLRPPRSGTVTLDGTPIADVDPADLHRRIALVTQEVHVFAGSVADNLLLGGPAGDPPRAALRDALDAVGAIPWVEALPDGLDTAVGGGAHRLTAGQAQQLALARLLLIGPELVVLDEATAEAGSDAARTLDAAAARVLAGRSAVVIAHRLGQARAADRIVVLQAGRIAEQGSHEALVAAGGEYARLWAAWDAAG